MSVPDNYALQKAAEYEMARVATRRCQSCNQRATNVVVQIEDGRWFSRVAPTPDEAEFCASHASARSIWREQHPGVPHPDERERD